MSPNPSQPFTRRSFLKSSAAISAATIAAMGTNYAFAAGSDRVRVGVVGLGGRGKGAAGNCVDSSPNTTITAIGDLFPDVVEATVSEFAGRPKEKYDVKKEQAFSGWDAYKNVIASDVDLVILATPPGFRPMMIEAAANAGKHIFAEKPVAVDPAGVRKVIAAHETLAKKNLGFVAGTQRRHQPGYIEVIKRLHDGMIGEITSMNVYWMQEGLWVKPRQPNWSDMEWQVRNWLYFTWLSGDHIVEQHMHQHDVANWVMRSTPKLCIGMGGRVSRTDPQYGHIYDHFAVEYEYPNGARVTSMCRQIDGTYRRIGEHVVGTKGTAIPESRIMEYGKKAPVYRYDLPDVEDPNEINPYVLEHRDLIKSIRAGKPLNEAKQAAESALTAIMGRMAAYTGQAITFDAALKSPLDLMPKELKFGDLPVPPPAVPGRQPAPAAKPTQA